MPWSEYHDINGKRFCFMTMEDPPGILIDVQTLARLTPDDLEGLKEWARRYADERSIIYRARDYEWRTQYLDEDVYRAVLAAETATDEDRAAAEAALEALARGQEYPPPPEQVHQPRGPVAGFVYLLSADSGLYKIGRTINLTKRVTHLAVKLPVRIELVHSIPSSDYVWAEETLHERFADKRDHGEWFALREGDVHAICSLDRLDPPA
ncbi:MAG: GIY-YIG nuclease family protein [Bacteroidota bacterium]